MSEHNPKGTNSNTPASNSPLADALWAALGTVEDPELRRPITELGMVERAQAVSEDDGGYVADVKILLTIEGCPLKPRSSRMYARPPAPLRASPGFRLRWVP